MTSQTNTPQPALLIDCHKIINWLQQRRKLNKDWYTYQKISQQKLKLLLKNDTLNSQYSSCSNKQLLPFIKQHIQNFNYYDLVKVVNMLLSSSWAENKSMMFGYADKRVKQWTNLKKFMDGKNVSFVNIAKFINQGLSFQLPSMDKNIELLDNQISTLKRKIDFNCNAIYQQQKQQNNQRNKMGFLSMNNTNNSSNNKTANILNNDINIMQQNIKQINTTTNYPSQQQKTTIDNKNTQKSQITLSITQQIPHLIKQIPTLFKQIQNTIKDRINKYYQMYCSFCQKYYQDGDGNDKAEEKNYEKQEMWKMKIVEWINKRGNDFVDNIERREGYVQVEDDGVKYREFYNWKPYNQWGIQQQSTNTNKNNTTKQKNLITILQHRPTRLLLLQQLNQLLYFFYSLNQQQSSSSSSISQSLPHSSLVQSQIQQIISVLQSTIELIINKVVPKLQLKNNDKAYQILIRKFRNYQQNVQQIMKSNLEYQQQIKQMTQKRQQYVIKFRQFKKRLIDAKNLCQKLLTQFMKRQIRITGQINKFQ